MTATLQAKADRLKEIDDLTAGLTEDDVRIKAPSLWKEKTNLLAEIIAANAENQALAASRQAEEDARQRKADFPAKADKFCADAFAAGRPLEDAVLALLTAHATVLSLYDTHNALANEARQVGLSFPTFAATLGISDAQLQRLHHACGLLSLTDH